MLATASATTLTWIQRSSCDAPYVPGLSATLISTKARFQKQGIRTYLNDEHCLVLPNDNHVRIRKTSANYTAKISLDTVVYVVTNDNDAVKRAMWQVGQFESLVTARLGRFPIDVINASVNHLRSIKKQLRHTRPYCCTRKIGGAR
eukprot:6202708-Pleurochrysis_carterae.AAC.2